MLTKARESSVDSVEQLVNFTKLARERGMEFGTIRELLLSAGWKDASIREAFSSGLEIPIPPTAQKGGAIEAFYHLSGFSCLYVAVVSLVVMLFNLIDMALPDPADSYYGYSSEWTLSSIRFSLSFVIVFAPLYLIFNRLIHRQTLQGALVRGGTVQRWLTYLTLFVIVVTILVDAATLVFTLLEGEMTTRVFVKSVLLFATVGGVFAYLWMETKKWSTKLD
jgi:hypothetical protein